MEAIYHGDCVKVLGTFTPGSVDLVFADPPFNIGLKYDEHNDEMTYDDYVGWVDEWMSALDRVLKPSGSIYLAISDEMAAEIALAMKKRFTMRNWLIWNYSFGQNTKKKFNRCKTHILYFVKGKEFTWNGGEIKVPSARMRYGDKRAAAGGKMPDDVWDVTETPEYQAEYERRMDALDDMPGGRQGATPDMRDWIEMNTGDTENGSTKCAGEEITDVWKVSRLCGTFGERIKKADGSVHPCQMPESILERIIKVSSNPGDLVVDPFGGTGTTAAVAKRLGRGFATMDRSESYCQVIAQRLFGDPTRFIDFAG
jgi:site-specific DNA-methyltransferase (adenine-specific)